MKIPDFSNLIPARIGSFGGTLPDNPTLRGLGIRRLSAFCGRTPAESGEAHIQTPDWVIGGTLGGTASVLTDGKEYGVKPGSVYIIPPLLPFIERHPAGTEWTWFCLLIQMTPQSPLTLGLPRHPVLFLPPPSFLELITTAATELYEREREFERLVLGLALQAMAEVARYSPGQTGHHAGFVLQARELMRRRVASGVTLKELAHECHMSLSSFCHRFREETGMPPMHGFMQERVRAAKRLLLEGRSVSEVASLLGFSNPYHFSRVFRNMEGIPPSQFGRNPRALAKIYHSVTSVVSVAEPS